jgi:adenosylhomocysteine nucleosidase
MRILVTFAVEAEFGPWQKFRGFRCVARKPFEIYEANLEGSTVCVALTGVGWEHARKSAHAVLQDPFDLCMSSGLAGGLKAQYKPGEILVFRSVGEITGTRVVPSDARLVSRASHGGAQIVSRLMTSKRLIVSAEEKHQLGRFGDAVDMESFPVLAAAQERGIPAVAIRAISDTAKEDLPMDFSRHTAEDGRVAIRGVLGEIARRPQILPALVRFGVRTRRVVDGLAKFLDSLIPSLAVDSVEKTEKVVAG